MGKPWILWALLGLIGMSSTGCLEINETYLAIPPGPWRGVLKLDNNPVMPNPRGEPLPEKLNLEFEEITAGELPFNFTVSYTNDSTFTLALLNANQTLPLGTTSFGRTKARARDTIRVEIPTGGYLRAFYEENLLEGEWIYPDSTSDRWLRIPFVAYFGQDHRFTNLRKPPTSDLNGEWEITFLDENQPQTGILDLKQQFNTLSAALRTDSLTCTHLAGTIQAEKLYLSYFDGKEAYLLEAKLREDGSLVGSLRLDRAYRTIWEARRKN